jgi:hypothetical protein
MGVYSRPRAFLGAGDHGHGYMPMPPGGSRASTYVTGVPRYVVRWLEPLVK